MEFVIELVDKIADIGATTARPPLIEQIEIFQYYFSQDGKIDSENLEKRDGVCTRRELLLRFLVLNAVLDQGPDIEGVRRLLVTVTNNLYQNEIRFLHSPIEFFQEIGIAVQHILSEHDAIKEIRSMLWAEENQSSPNKYNLFMDNCKQVLNYAIFRWGVPLALPLLLERDVTDVAKKHDVLLKYLKSWPSAEIMSQQLKDNERYGLGKAIGDKACHLFAKWTVSSFNLLNANTPNWGIYSFEIPFDSNAGRVLWRTGFLLKWANEREYVQKSVIQKGKGKGGLDYIRVTNIRGMKTNTDLPNEIWQNYFDLACSHLCSHKKGPKKAEIQRIPHAFLMSSTSSYGVAEFDDGLIHIGTKYCFNHDKPRCNECPISSICEGNNNQPYLIAQYRT